MWTPGYWAYGPDGYYWVPGTWVEAPAVGLLWTPGYWGWGNGVYLWHGGYWGPHVGFYGGINYGFGYGGVGFYGGAWRNGVFAYNTAVMHVDPRYVHNTYVDRTVIRNTNVSRVSFNGGRGGIMAQPTAQERLAERDNHIGATSMQTQHEHAASTNRAFLASENHGRPAIAATSRAGDFNRGVVASRGTTASAPRGGTSNATARSNNPSVSRNNANATRTNANAARTRTNANAPRGGNPNSNAARSGAGGGARPSNAHVNQSHNQPQRQSNPPKNDEKHH
jgi:hypothetical protein